MSYGLQNFAYWVESEVVTVLSRDFDSPVESAHGLVRDSESPVEWTGLFIRNRDFSAPVEWFFAAARAFDLPVDWGAQRLRDFDLPAEWHPEHTREFGLPYEWFISTTLLVRDFGTPTEWGGQAPDTLPIVFNVLQKLDSSLGIQWNVVNAGLVKFLPVTWNVLTPLPVLPITWRVLPNLPATFQNDLQRPFGSVEETP